MRGGAGSRERVKSFCISSCISPYFVYCAIRILKIPSSLSISQETQRKAFVWICARLSLCHQDKPHEDWQGATNLPFLEVVGGDTPGAHVRVPPGLSEASRQQLSHIDSPASPNKEMCRKTPRKSLADPAGCRNRDKTVLITRKCYEVLSLAHLILWAEF